MKFLIITVSLVIIGIGGFFASSYLADPAVTPTPVLGSSEFMLAVIDKSVFLKNPADANFKEIEGSVIVYEGSEVKTSKTGRATLLYPNDTISALDADTYIKITTLSNAGSTSSIRLVSGGMWSKIKNVLGVGESYEVRTDNIVASVRGTIFVTEFRNNRSTVFVLQNKVKVSVFDVKGEPILGSDIEIESGSKVAVALGDRETISQPITNEDLRKPVIDRNLETTLRVSPSPSPQASSSPRQTVTPTPKPVSTPTPTLVPIAPTQNQITPTPTPPPPENTEVTFDSVFPKSVSSGEEFTLNGTNFITGRNIRQVASVTLNTISVKFAVIDGQTVFATAELNSGVYDVSLVTVSGKTLTLKGALSIK